MSHVLSVAQRTLGARGWGVCLERSRVSPSIIIILAGQVHDAGSLLCKTGKNIYLAYNIIGQHVLYLTSYPVLPVMSTTRSTRSLPGTGTGVGYSTTSSCETRDKPGSQVISDAEIESWMSATITTSSS
jgi:hypothetical protein